MGTALTLNDYYAADNPIGFASVARARALKEDGYAPNAPSLEAEKALTLALIKRELLKESQLHFTKHFFKARESVEFACKWHHLAIARAFDAVAAGKITRLIITMPPGFTKTVMLIDFLARMYAVDPLCKNIMVTYNDKVARKNSQLLMDTLNIPDYRNMFQPRIRQSVSSKGRWLTELPTSTERNYQGNGEFLASGILGTITSFRAGRYTPGVYSGCIAIDDPIKPKDAFKKYKRDEVNDFFNTTLRSRLMLPETPIILIMQRLHTDDPVGFCLAGGTGDYWHHLNIPARVEKQHIKPGKQYARANPYGIPLIYKDIMTTGYSWPEKINKRQLKIIKAGDPFVEAAQYQQSPRLVEGNFIKSKWLRFYDELPPFQQIIKVVAITDTAFEKNSWNDQTVVTVWAVTRDRKAYLLYYHGFRMEVPETTTELIRVWNSFSDNRYSKYPKISEFYVEKKASGHGIIHTMQRNGINVKPMERNTDKVQRAMNSVPALISGTINFPGKNVRTDFTDGTQWEEMTNELLSFSADMSHLHDDYCDCIFDAAKLFYSGIVKLSEVFG